MDIEIRLLRSFVAIHEAGSVSRAAGRMACTQAAMSMRLKLLEAEIGAPLFLRRPGGLQPTPRGAELYAKALGVLSAYDEMMSLTRTRPPRDRLRIGMPDDYAAGWLGELLTALGPQFARMELELTCDLSANLLAALERRDLDLVVVTTASPPPRALASVSLPLLWLGQPPDPATGDEVVLAVYPEGCVFRRAMTQALDAAGRPWRIGVQARARAALMAAVASGRAVTAVAPGTAPAGMLACAAPTGLPVLPEVALHVVLGDAPPAAARRAAAALADRLALRVA